MKRYVDRADALKTAPLATLCQEFYDPLWSVLGFCPKRLGRKAGEIAPDYELRDAQDQKRTVALAYQWERWLDGPDPSDPDRPTENPGAAVVTLLERGDADWVIVTNGKLWRLYSKAAHSRSTNFYEVDLPGVLIASGLSDPNEAFRYWWLFFRVQAFLPVEDATEKCWLDTVVRGSREYAAEVEDELKRRVFYDVVPALAHGFLHDRRERLKQPSQPTEAELEQIRHGTLTLLYRLLFLLYAESRDLLPVREAEYYKLSIKSLKEEIAAKAGVAESEADGKLNLEYKKSSTALYDRLADPESGLFAAMADGRPAANVPKYNGGLFRLDPAEASDDHEREVSEFLNTHKVPDRFLAPAIDRLARVEDSRTYQLAFVDYKSLGVRQLGSIYEGLLEFRLRIAEEDLAVTDRKKLGDWIPLSKTRAGRKRRYVRETHAGDPYLVRDKSERKATGSYYTPDHIVEYIVENTVGPVLNRKAEALRHDFRKAEKAFYKTLANAEADRRMLLGWRPAWGGPLEGASGSPLKQDLRRFALEKTYDAHKDLVEKLFDLKVLDPAMGSGHFLVEAVDFITDELLHFLNAFPVNPVSAAIERTREAILQSLREQGLETDEALKKQLTDVHLLKRHVLKRCIYGVDLNPLATELAKVSLWLDAFTLGAPLSFLDHHLRTGNSLIGSSLKELESAVEGQLFKIDESHLYRAVQNVLTVARLADATASEVAESKRAHDEARRTLAGYGVLLDILVAKHFGQAATTILAHGGDLDLSSQEAFFSSLRPFDRKLVQKVEPVAAEQSFFHWDLEFPEVFFTFTGLAEGRIERRSPEDSGFEVVVGNPPYDVLSELENAADLSGFKSFIDATRSLRPSQRGKNNLYKLFICRAMEMLADSGRLGFIVPMAVLGDDSAADVRKAMLGAGTLAAVEAFPQKDDPARRVFSEAKLSTAVFVMVKTGCPTLRAAPFRTRQHPENRIDEGSPSLLLRTSEIPLYDPENQALVSCSQADWDLAVRVMGSGRMQRLGEYVECFQGEVNETNERAKGTIGYKPGVGLEILRGAHVCLYCLRDASQGTAIYLDSARFLDGKDPESKAYHHLHDRVGFQRKSPQNNFRRLIACPVPAGAFLLESVSYYAGHTSFDS